jgi:hypothetical protein
MRKWFQYLQQLDIADFDWNDRPITDAYLDMRDNDLKLEAQFLRDTVETAISDRRYNQEFSSTDLYQMYQAWLSTNNIRVEDLNSKKFGKRMMNCIRNMSIVGINKPETRTRDNKYNIDFKKLNNWFVDNNYLPETSRVIEGNISIFTNVHAQPRTALDEYVIRVPVDDV